MCLKKFYLHAKFYYSRTLTKNKTKPRFQMAVSLSSFRHSGDHRLAPSPPWVSLCPQAKALDSKPSRDTLMWH